MKNLLLLIFILSSFILHSQEISYTVSMEKPHTHYFEVSMTVKGHAKDYVDVHLPVWAPGSYLVREFAKSLEDIHAAYNKKELPLEKVNKNTWRIQTENAEEFTVNYKIYAYEMSVRTSFLDASHGYFNGTSMFLYIDDLKQSPCTLTIEPYKTWKKVSTALPKTAEKGYVYRAENYDILVDSPVEIGNQETFDFDAAGVKHHVAIYGKGNHNIEQLKIDMAKIVEACTAVFGVNPNKEYTFIIHNLTKGSGGLEHLSSTTLQVNRWTYEGEDYKGFLSLVAHEYFHLWNVKRVRPIELGPFDYNSENYTTLLWVMEGFTSYYDELLLYRAGFYTQEEILSKFNRSINSIENQPGNKVQPVAHASFDAWIKAYRPTENSYNTTISYYTKGSVVANMLDIIICNNSKGKKNLDDVMKLLYNEYYLNKKRGFTAEEMKGALEKVAGSNLDDFYTKYINGTQSFDYKTLFGHVGIGVQEIVDKSPSLGVSTGSNNVIRRVKRGSSAYEGGLNVDDEILAIDGFRVSHNLNDLISSKNVGDPVEVLISRDNIIQTISFNLKESGALRYYIAPESTAKNAAFKKWMSK